MNKLTKLLSVFIIAGAIGTGVAGAVGCSHTDPTPDGEHNHQTWSTTGEDNGNGTHKLTCTTEGCTETKDEAHKDADEDDVCDVCLADMEAADPNAITSIVISFDNASPKAGQTVKCTATCTPDTAADKSVTWSITSGDSLATIDATTGVLTVKDTATSGGEVTVKATSVATPTKSATKIITLQKANQYDRLSKLTSCKVNSANWTNAQSLTEITAENVGKGGIYTHGTNAAVSITDGVATTNGGGLYVDFGDTSEAEIIEGALSVKIVKTSGSGWGFTRIMNRTFANTDDYALSGRDNGQYRINAGSTNLGDAGTSVGAAVPSAWIEVYFKFDKSSGMAVLKHGDTTVYNGPVSQTDVVGIGIFGKATSDANQLEIKDVAICAYTLTLDEYKANNKEMVDGIAAETLKLQGSGWTYEGDTDNLGTGAAITKLLADFEAALTAATDKPAVDAAVADASEAYVEIIGKEYTAKVNAVYPATDYSGAENGPAYTAALNSLKEDLAEAAMTPAEFTKILENYVKKDGVFDLILTNAEANKMTVVIEIYNGTTKIGTVTTVNGATLKDGAKVTFDDIADACTVSEANKCVGTIYTDADLAEAHRVNGDYTALAENGEESGEGEDKVSTIKLYVSLGELKTINIGAEFDAGNIKSKAKDANDSTYTTVTGLQSSKLSEHTIYKLSDEVIFQGKKDKVTGIKEQAAGGYTKGLSIDGSSDGNQLGTITVDSACKITIKFACAKSKDFYLYFNSKAGKASNIEKDSLAYGQSGGTTDVVEVSYRITAPTGGTVYFLGSEAITIFEIKLAYGGEVTAEQKPSEGGDEENTTVTATLKGTDILSDGYTEATAITSVNNGFFTMTGGTKTDSKGEVKNTSAKQEAAVANSGTYSKIMSFGQGKATTTANSIKFTVDSECTVKVVACAKNGKTNIPLAVLDSTGANATVTNLKLTAADGTVTNPTDFAVLPEANKDDKTLNLAVTYEFTLAAGTYYIGGGVGGGACIFELAVTYTPAAE